MASSSRIAAIRSALANHLEIFAEPHRKMLLELVSLAEVGERARQLVSGLTVLSSRPTSALLSFERAATTTASAPKKRAPAAKAAPSRKPALAVPAAKAAKRPASAKAKKPPKAVESPASAVKAPKKPKPPQSRSKPKPTIPATTATAPKSVPPKASTPPASATSTAAGAASDQPTLRQLLLGILGESATPLSLKDIGGKVAATGYKSSSANFAKVLSVALSNLKEVKRVDKGVYALESAPAS